MPIKPTEKVETASFPIAKSAEPPVFVEKAEESDNYEEDNFIEESIEKVSEGNSEIDEMF